MRSPQAPRSDEAIPSLIGLDQPGPRDRVWTVMTVGAVLVAGLLLWFQLLAPGVGVPSAPPPAAPDVEAEPSPER